MAACGWVRNATTTIKQLHGPMEETVYCLAYSKQRTAWEWVVVNENFHPCLGNTVQSRNYVTGGAVSMGKTASASMQMSSVIKKDGEAM